MDNKSELDNRTQRPGRYRHYKGAEYLVVGTALHSETEELLVIYQPDYGDRRIWARPYDMFNEKLVVDGKAVNRFEFVSEK